MALSDEFEIVKQEEKRVISTEWICCAIPNDLKFDDNDMIGWTVVDNNKIVGLIIWQDEKNIILYCDYNIYIKIGAKAVNIKDISYSLY